MGAAAAAVWEQELAVSMSQYVASKHHVNVETAVKHSAAATKSRANYTRQVG